jgi:hypothetical protein
MGEVAYQFYSYVLILNIHSGAKVTWPSVFNMLRLVSSDFSASMYFVLVKGHTY